MGGGGVVRGAASKVANFAYIGAGRGGFRGAPSQEQSIATIISSSSTTKNFPNPEKPISISSSSPNGNLKSSSLIQNQTWGELDDWEFTDDDNARDEILLSKSKQSLGRVVFGEVPSLEEAKEATSDLKNALEKSSSFVTKEQGLEVSETKACVTSETTLAFPPMSKPVFQAFSLLKESPEAQNVVASLASDKNVWDAVMQNPKVMDFLKLHQTDKEFNDNKESPKNFDHDNSLQHCETLGDMFVKSIQNLKFSVMKMIDNLSLFFQDMIEDQGAASNISLDGNGNATATNAGRIMGGSFMALAVMAIMVVVIKRG